MDNSNITNDLTGFLVVLGWLAIVLAAETTVLTLPLHESLHRTELRRSIWLFPLWQSCFNGLDDCPSKRVQSLGASGYLMRVARNCLMLNNAPLLQCHFDSFEGALKWEWSHGPPLKWSVTDALMLFWYYHLPLSKFHYHSNKWVISSFYTGFPFDKDIGSLASSSTGHWSDNNKNSVKGDIEEAFNPSWN